MISRTNPTAIGAPIEKANSVGCVFTRTKSGEMAGWIVMGDGACEHAPYGCYARYVPGMDLGLPPER